MKTILVTGAAGGVGTFLREEFRGRYRLRLSDIAALDDCGPDEAFVAADPSVKNGLVTAWRVRPWTVVIGN